MSRRPVGLAALPSKFQERVVKLVTLVEVLHEIPPRAGKCQTGRIGKFRGEEGKSQYQLKLACVRGGRAS